VSQDATDERWMRRCLELAERAVGRTAPNPMVGCVVVDAAGRVLAEGFHERAGAPHAEAVALASLGGRAEGATLYVNLEPCAHTSKRRTQPCAPLVARSGIRRLVYGMADPFPGHGGGIDQARAEGIRVDGPVLEGACRRLNEAFVTFARDKRVHVTLKAAMSLDGRIATVGGESRWITGEAARADAHRLRNRLDAILVGAGTVLADDPQLTTRGVPEGRDPVRVVLDGKLRVPPTAKILRAGSAAGPTLIATTQGAPASRQKALEKAGAEVWRLPGRGHRVDLKALARGLAKRGLLSLLVEGGGETHAAFLQAGLCDRLVLYAAPMALGGQGAPSWLGGEGFPKLKGAPRFRWDGPPVVLGDDLRLELVPWLVRA
jgi:diaminohydroxyphosphoribosylaminopyrimidine deaminase/5-amino-6-(5-phosphoribosylamino)uracil reductase